MKYSLWILPLLAGPSALAQITENVHLTGVPDYTWHAGCFGTATGNLIGFWDRHGFPGFYTGPTAGGVAPLDSIGPHANIRSLWASQAGVDGRPASSPGHMDDYYVEYESVAPDPYLAAGRPEHAPDCIGDFIGVNQNKWSSLNGECSGNIDGFSFVFWDPTGARRTNFVPDSSGGPPVDIPSGLRAWTHWRGSEALAFSQLTEFNPEAAPGAGFTFQDLRREIDAGYPVLLFMQQEGVRSRTLHGVSGVNPNIHGMLAYGYLVMADGRQFVRFRTSWGSGDNALEEWKGGAWRVTQDLGVRGVIGYRPQPQIRRATLGSASLRIEWDGPASERRDLIAGTTAPVHSYQIESTHDLSQPTFQPITQPSTDRFAEVPIPSDPFVFYRVRLIHANDTPSQ